MSKRYTIGSHKRADIVDRRTQLMQVLSVPLNETSDIDQIDSYVRAYVDLDVCQKIQALQTHLDSLTRKHASCTSPLVAKYYVKEIERTTKSIQECRAVTILESYDACTVELRNTIRKHQYINERSTDSGASSTPSQAYGYIDPKMTYSLIIEYVSRTSKYAPIRLDDSKQCLTI